MKPKVYIETSIVGYLTGRTSRDAVTAGHQAITREWWTQGRQAYDLYCSTLVLDEAGVGDKEEAEQRLANLAGLPVLGATPESELLAQTLLKRKAVPAKAGNDAVHLAMAAVAGMDYLLTWNCRHLANASLRPLMARVCTKAGFGCPIICTPEGLFQG